MSFFQNTSAATDVAPLTLDYGNGSVRKFARSQEDLAQELGGISRRTVARLLKMPGNPGKTANGSYPLEAWRAFYEEIKEDDIPEEIKGELSKVRLERERVRLQKEQIELEILEKTVIPAETVKAEWQAFFSRIRQQVFKIFVEETNSVDEFEEAQKKFHKLLARIHEGERERSVNNG
ncbi:MAG: hypothetical protein IJY80_03900 [Opitutales bacterium]|nr:hypothetical protein [Opitutales bacterium]